MCIDGTCSRAVIRARSFPLQTRRDEGPAVIDKEPRSQSCRSHKDQPWKVFAHGERKEKEEIPAANDAKSKHGTHLSCNDGVDLGLGPLPRKTPLHRPEARLDGNSSRPRARLHLTSLPPREHEHEVALLSAHHPTPLTCSPTSHLPPRKPANPSLPQPIRPLTAPPKPDAPAPRTLQPETAHAPY
ncbi:hypothetical protein EJ04DRAFT_230716 [Polyplosphaeria fusca]|uniref:Uncharacterized protein n=1 Tax=Polyplosphaeria fusca TaxID=682080 RepID=A0A9P4V1K7_9PLEO|nr:hypothetical protein EJ04DRAFT_230716 [Polyplosphaeria fusca]